MTKTQIYLACTLIALWLGLLLVGLVAGGATHLLLGAALGVVVWPLATSKPKGQTTETAAAHPKDQRDRR